MAHGEGTTVTIIFVVLLKIAIHLLFQIKIHPLPQEGNEECAEESNPNRCGLLEMSREGHFVGDENDANVLVSEVLVLERNCRPAGGIQVRRVRRRRQARWVEWREDLDVTGKGTSIGKFIYVVTLKLTWKPREE